MYRVINGSIKFLKFFLILLMVTGWMFSGWPRIWKEPPIPPEIEKAQAAITFFGDARMPASENGNSAATSATTTPPGSMLSGDFVLVFVSAGTTGVTITNSAAGGQSWTAGTDSEANSMSYRSFYAIYDGTWDTSPAWSWTNSVPYEIWMLVFRGVAQSSPIDAAENIAGFAAPASPYDVTIATSTITTQTDGAIVVAMWTSFDNNTWALQETGWTNPSGYAYWRNSGGSDTSMSVAYQIQGTIGGNGGVTDRQTAVAPDAGIISIIAIKPPTTTTLGDGTDPTANPTVAPGTAFKYLDQFTFKTNTGTDSVTAITVVTPDPTAIASMGIYDEAMTTQYFSTSSVPSGNNWSFSGVPAIPVTTATSSYRVYITIKSHAALAAGTYAVTGTASSTFTSGNGNTIAGSDADSDTINVDNSPPSDATWGTITPGNQEVALNWSNGGSTFLILRKATTTISDAPTDGSTYTVPGNIGTSAIIYVNNGTSFTDSPLDNGTNYYYKIFAYDSYLNYAAGAVTGPHTPVSSFIICSVDGTGISFGTIDNTQVYDAPQTSTTTISANIVAYLKVYDNASTSPGLWSSTSTPHNIIGSANDNYDNNDTLDPTIEEGYGIRAATTTDGSGNNLNMSYRFNEIFGTFATQPNYVGGLEAGLSNAIALASTTAGTTTSKKVVVKYKVAVTGSTIQGDYKSEINYLCVPSP